jgi:hypothetical protein
MQDSRIIEADGVFLGAAVCLPDAQGWRFVAANDRVGKIDGVVVPSLPETRRLAKQAYLASGGQARLGTAA